jgi:hypothetical protein
LKKCKTMMAASALTIILSGILSGVSSGTAHANDSSSAIGLGGLELTLNNAVSMDSEDLFLSMDKVVVKYQFTNNTAKDVETLVSFPLPPVPGGIGYLGDGALPDWKDFDFQTLVGGVPVTYDKIVKVTANGKDVTARLKQLGWQVEYWDYENEAANAKWFDLGQSEKQAYVDEGLLKWRDNDKKYVRPVWQVTTYITRKQVFPAGKTINVEHSYKPITGGTIGGMLEKSNRRDPGFKDYSTNFCIDKTFIQAFDKRRYSSVKNKNNDEGSFYVESWLDYILKSGANWQGPIKDFRLVIDKGNPGNLISLCMDGIKKISPTQFEVRKTNFEPKKNISILIARWAPLD